MILHIHKEGVDILDLDKIAENYVAGKEDTVWKFDLFLWTVWEIYRLVRLLKLTGSRGFIFVFWLNS